MRMCWVLLQKRVMCHTQRMGGINDFVLSRDENFLISVGKASQSSSFLHSRWVLSPLLLRLRLRLRLCVDLYDMGVRESLTCAVLPFL